MADPGSAPSGKPVGRGVLVLAVAALSACWNPLAAPFGLLVGLATVVLAVRALRRSGTGRRRRIPAAALAFSVVAVVASAATLALTAGVVGLELPGEPVVKGRTQAELDRTLSEAAERTRAQREQARRALDGIAGTERDRTPARGGADAGVPQPGGGRR